MAVMPLASGWSWSSEGEQKSTLRASVASSSVVAALMRAKNGVDPS